MTTPVKHLLLLPALIVGIGVVQTGRVTAQTLTTLYNVGDGYYNPETGVILSSNMLYGTLWTGYGAGPPGGIFGINPDGTGFTNFNVFTGTNLDEDPAAPLISSGNTLYGTSPEGGSFGYGTVFALNTDGTGFTVLHSFSAAPGFTNSDGAGPTAGLFLAGNTLYGTASSGGVFDEGTVYAVNTDGTGFTILHTFSAVLHGTNSDGARPETSLVLSGSILYGTTPYGGLSEGGTVFAINTNGSGFTNLHNFAGGPAESSTSLGGLVLSGNTLFGPSFNGDGVVFAINTEGTGFTNLHSFAGADGSRPYGILTLSGSTLYGTAYSGGSNGGGTVFAVNTDGTGFTNLHNFPAAPGEGVNPSGGVALSGNTLYGTTFLGGSGGMGTIFSLSFTPQLSIAASGTNVILSWPTNVAGFDYTGYTLQCATNLNPPAIWSAVSPPPVVVNGQLTVTNVITGTQMFYRLSE